MRNKLIVLTLILCVLLSGCGNNQTQEKNDIESPSPTKTVDLSGDKNVPKTEIEVVGGNYQEFTSLDAALKEYDGKFEVPDLSNEYDSEKYVIDGDCICALFERENGYVSIKKSSDVLEKGIETSYQFSYDKKIGTKDVKIYSRIDETSVGLVFWNDSDNYYSVEFSPYIEVDLETATSIINEVE